MSHAREATGHHLHFAPAEHEGAQVDVAGGNAAVHIGRAARQAERGLRDVA
eukprot:gene45745-57001_t